MYSSLIYNYKKVYLNNNISDFNIYHPDHTVVVVIISFSGMLLCLSTLLFLVKNRHKTLIKATGISLSLIVLLGVFITYPTALLMMAPPSHVVCNIASLGLHLGFCITYSSLLMVFIYIYIYIYI